MAAAGVSRGGDTGRMWHLVAYWWAGVSPDWGMER